MEPRPLRIEGGECGSFHLPRRGVEINTPFGDAAGDGAFSGRLPAALKY
jgi:hypothetical protein